ncbi:MAG: tyrosine--tRNA ligase [Candidatus Roizmanbacteria bacterium]
MNSFLDILKERGLVFQSTPGIEKVFEKGSSIYFGFDPTGDALHVGHLLGLSILKRAYENGQNIIVLVGGGTAMIGDPGGKDAERPILPKEQIEKNKQKLKSQMAHFFTFDEKRVIMVDNADWLENVSLIDFLRDAGKFVPINSMLDKDSVKSRIDREEGISYAEFSYQLLQAYDYLVLHEKYGVNVQIGGSDQWGNIVQGVELIRKKSGHHTFALSYPLIVNPKTGKKFGKTEGGAGIWLDSEKTHPFQLYQFFVNQDDELAVTLMKYFSFKSMNEIEAIIKEWEPQKETRTLQKVLAFELVSIIHNMEIAKMCQEMAHVLFDQGAKDITELQLEFVKKSLPYKKLGAEEQFQFESILVELKLVASKGEAKRLIQQNGARNRELFGKYFLIQKGKREYAVVEK